VTTICLHGKWRSSASFHRIFTKIAAFESSRKLRHLKVEIELNLKVVLIISR